jgi:hypothetical protein
MWRPIKAGVSLSLVLVLAGCLTPTDGPSSVPVLRQVALAGGTVIVTPPRGYCIDADSVSDRQGRGFALIGSCNTLTGAASGVFVEPAIITLSVTKAQNGDTKTDSNTFQTALGRGKILRAINRDDLSLLQVEGGATIPPSADERHWRGLMQVNGQVIGLALYGATDGPMTGDQGMRLLVDLADAIRRDSAAAARRAENTGAVASSATNAAE